MARVIFVDDDRTSAKLVKMLLEMEGHDVSVSPTIEHAKEHADGAQALIIDCHLEDGRSGLELLRDIRQGALGIAASTPVIVTSGDFRQDTPAIDAGADRFLLKPYSPNDLMRILQKLLSEDTNNG